MSKINHNKTKLIGRIILIIVVVIIAVMLVLTGLFNYYKDDIGRSVLLKVNKIQEGELAFDDIHFNPIKNFPNVSLELVDVEYFELKSENRAIDSLPIIELKNLFLAFDVIDLLKGDINVSKVQFVNGNVNLIHYADSSLNLMCAFGLDDMNQENLDSVKHADSAFKLDIENISLSDIKIYYNDIPENTISSYNIKSLNAALNYNDETINFNIKSNLELDEINLTGGFILSHKKINIETAVTYNSSTKSIKIDPSELEFGRASFKVEGKIDLGQAGYIDISVVGNDKDFSILSLFLSDAGVRNIKGGDLYFNGTIKGSLLKGIPMVDLSYGMSDVTIQIPNTNNRINKMSMNGDFHSGNKKDLSKAKLLIKDLKADLPGGTMKGHFSIENFSAPELDLDFHMDADVNGFNELFNLSLIDSLEGNLNIDLKLIGSIDLNTNEFVKDEGSSGIFLKNVSFKIPDVNPVNNVNGQILFGRDTAYFENFDLEIGKSDFNINGYLTHVYSLFTKINKNIIGEFHVTSDTYDFPDFFKYDPTVANSFPYQIEEIDLNVKLLTSTIDLTEFEVTPKIVFDIKSLNAEIKDFLPPISINEGRFTLEGIDSSLNLDFSNFDIDMAGSKLLTDVVFNSPKIDPNWLSVTLKVENLNPKKAFVYWTNDSISNFLNGRLDGSMYADLFFSQDTIMFDQLDFNAETLGFINSKDTFDLQHFSIKAKDVDFEISNSSNIMQTFSFDSKITSKSISTNHFVSDDLDYNVEASKGIYKIVPNNSQIFDQDGEGLLILSPFEETPSFELKFKVHQFEISELFKTFIEDTVMRGKMDLDLHLTSSGINRNEIEHNLNGKFLLSGKELTLYGLDLDKVIDRFKRSQKFTFADVGAVLLMGPAGILVTKGSDFASIVVLNPGESSKVIELSSDWQVDDGVIDLRDVAFTTQENRMAAKGWVNLVNDSLSIEMALLNELGCSVYSQEIFGSLDSIESSKVKVVKSLLAPVTNLLSIENKCDVFYNGKVKQPKKQKSKESKNEL